MPTPNEFWLALHALAEAHEREGVTPDERAQNIVEQFHKMPPQVRRQVLVELDQLVESLTDISVTVAAAQRSLESSPPISRGKMAHREFDG